MAIDHLDDAFVGGLPDHLPVRSRLALSRCGGGERGGRSRGEPICAADAADLAFEGRRMGEAETPSWLLGRRRLGAASGCCGCGSACELSIGSGEEPWGEDPAWSEWLRLWHARLEESPWWMLATSAGGGGEGLQQCIGAVGLHLASRLEQMLNRYRGGAMLGSDGVQMPTSTMSPVASAECEPLLAGTPNTSHPTPPPKPDPPLNPSLIPPFLSPTPYPPPLTLTTTLPPQNLPCRARAWRGGSP